MSRSVRRVIGILDFLLDAGRVVSIGEMISGLGISRTTAYDTLRTLQSFDYVRQDPATGKYGFGRRVYELGIAYSNQVDLLKEGSAVAQELCDETCETVQLSVLDHGTMLVLLKHQGSQSISIISQIGSRLPVNWAASGRLLVSDFSDQELRDRLPSMIEPSPTGNAPLDIDVLIQQVRQARRKGYAIQVNQANQHAGAIAAPVVDVSGRCIATISVVAPEHRLKREHRQRLIAAVVAAAARLSSRLGGIQDSLPANRSGEEPDR